MKAKIPYEIPRGNTYHFRIAIPKAKGRIRVAGHGDSALVDPADPLLSFRVETE
jgi:hypothetical protein